MKYTYEIIEVELPMGSEKIIRRNDGLFIPFAEDNSDYQTYLRWLENPDAELGETL